MDCSIRCCSAASSRLLIAPVNWLSAARVMFLPTAITGTIPSFLGLPALYGDAVANGLLTDSDADRLAINEDLPCQRPGQTPNRHCTASVRPAPTSPAMPRISPRCRENETSLTRLI